MLFYKKQKGSSLNSNDLSARIYLTITINRKHTTRSPSVSSDSKDRKRKRDKKYDKKQSSRSSSPDSRNSKEKGLVKGNLNFNSFNLNHCVNSTNNVLDPKFEHSPESPDTKIAKHVSI